MRIAGLILLILGIVAAVNAINAPVVRSGNEAYDKGARLGRGSAPVVLMGLGLGLLLRGSRRSERPTTSRPVSAGQYQRPTAAPAFPSTMPVKIQCSCGQHYAFDVEPVAGRMPTHVACPACGVDGTDAANASIAQTLALRASTATAAPPVARRKLHPALLMGIGAAALVFLLVAALFVRSLIRFNRVRPARPPAYNSEAARPNSPPPGNPGRVGGPAPPPATPGSRRDAAPVPPDATSVEVFWGSSWYKATILRREGPRTFIHYEGWSSTFDEWVTPDRLRPRR